MNSVEHFSNGKAELQWVATLTFVPCVENAKQAGKPPHTNTEPTEMMRLGESVSSENVMECFTHLQDLFYMSIRETKATRDICLGVALLNESAKWLENVLYASQSDFLLGSRVVVRGFLMLGILDLLWFYRNSVNCKSIKWKTLTVSRLLLLFQKQFVSVSGHIIYTVDTVYASMMMHTLLTS